MSILTAIYREEEREYSSREEYFIRTQIDNLSIESEELSSCMLKVIDILNLYENNLTIEGTDPIIQDALSIVLGEDLRHYNFSLESSKDRENLLERIWKRIKKVWESLVKRVRKLLGMNKGKKKKIEDKINKIANDINSYSDKDKEHLADSIINSYGGGGGSTFTVNNDYNLSGKKIYDDFVKSTNENLKNYQDSVYGILKDSLKENYLIVYHLTDNLVSARYRENYLEAVDKVFELYFREKVKSGPRFEKAMGELRDREEEIEKHMRRFLEQYKKYSANSHRNMFHEEKDEQKWKEQIQKLKNNKTNEQLIIKYLKGQLSNLNQMIEALDNEINQIDEITLKFTKAFKGVVSDSIAAVVYDKKFTMSIIYLISDGFRVSLFDKKKGLDNKLKELAKLAGVDPMDLK